MTGIVIVVAGLMYLAIRAMTRERTDGRHHIGDMLEKRFGIDDAGAVNWPGLRKSA